MIRTLNPVLIRVFLPFAAGYFLSYLYRVVNGVIAPDLIGDIGIGPAALGLLTASYFISFASFQLPLGIFLDRIGPRRVEGILLLFAALGSFIFARAESLAGLIAGRALIGFGVSACLMAAFKAYAIWFEPQKWPLINGFQMASGGLGVLAATSPVEFLLGFTDWRGIFLMLSGLTLLVAILVISVVPEKSASQVPESFPSQLAGVRTVFSRFVFWQAAPLTVLSQASFLSIQGLWAGPWLHDVSQLEREQVASLLFLIGLAMIGGWLILGSTAARLTKRNMPLLTVAVAGMGLFTLAQLLVLTTPISWLRPVWIFFGFAGTSGILAYPALSQAFPVRLSGRVTTSLNLLVFVAAFGCQWLMGAIIGLWPETVDGRYGEKGYRVAFSLVLISQILALLWYFIADRIKKKAGNSAG